ncbi:alpha/beta-hydrolase [Phellopilus nigrolimitatus]|nr:alpha/beta-hydrolase [Phellopilus nigrolimitatus]
MHFIASALVFAFTAAVAAGPVEKRGISQSLMDSFTHYVQFASGAYQLACPAAPLGTTLITQFNDDATNTQGYVARDDGRKEIVVAYRGSIQLQDFVTDADFIMVDYVSPGVSGTSGVQAHQGFLAAINSVVSTVLKAVSKQLAAHPTYTLISTGHSLGAALASLGGVSLAANFPGVPLTLYTFGQPRTGNPAYAALAEKLVGVDNIFRTVETYDGVPTIPPISFGYEHHATQYWVFQDRNTDPGNVKRCAGREDPTCSDLIPSSGINDAHLRYFGQVILLNQSSAFESKSWCQLHD